MHDTIGPWLTSSHLAWSLAGVIFEQIFLWLAGLLSLHLPRRGETREKNILWHWNCGDFEANAEKTKLTKQTYLFSDI